MKENSINPEELMQKLKDNQLSDDELRKINGGGGFYIEVDPSKCPYHYPKSIYVANYAFLYSYNECARCEHNIKYPGYIRNDGYALYCCEFAYTRELIPKEF